MNQNFKFSLINEVDLRQALMGSLTFEQASLLESLLIDCYDRKLVNLIYKLISNGSFNYRNFCATDAINNAELEQDHQLLSAWEKQYLKHTTGDATLVMFLLDPLAVYTERDLYISEYQKCLDSYLSFGTNAEDPESCVYNLLVSIIHIFDSFFVYNGLNNDQFYSTNLIVMRKGGELLVAIKQ